MHSMATIQARFALSVFCCAALLGLQSASGAVVIIANRTKSPVRIEARPQLTATPQAKAPSKPRESTSGLRITLGSKAATDTGWQSFTIEAGDLVAVPMNDAGTLAVRGGGIGTFDLKPFGVYYIGLTRANRVELREIAFGIPNEATTNREVIGALADVTSSTRLGASDDLEARRTISVAVYVDEEEPAVEQLWKRRLQRRVDAASRVLERSCGMKFAVAYFGTWKSNDGIDDFGLSLREFETHVRPNEARLSIGFTSQYQLTKGRTHLGGTRGPLHTHILLREWSNHVSESERLELLVHELSHFLGAAHSPESNSVMRPILGDRQANARSFRIAVDPVNALVMSLVAEEVRQRGVTSFRQLSTPTQARLNAIYTTLARALPKDPAAPDYLKLLNPEP
jgi:hypothetical protein